LKNNKKSESQYISWILLLGMTIVLSYFLFNWSLSQAKQTTETIEKTADPLVCEELGFSLDGICQDSKTLIFNVTNSNNVEITGFLIKATGLYPEDNNYLSSKKIQFIVSPGDTEKIKMMKKMTLSQVEITPFTTKNNKDIYCEGVSVKKEMRELKQCG
jgi:hypothetical protein